MRKLTLVKSPQQQPKRGRACYKMTFWLTAPEYLQYIRAATLARLSATKYLIRACGLEDAVEKESRKMVQAAMAKMRTPPSWFQKERPARRSRQAARPAARLRRAA